MYDIIYPPPVKYTTIYNRLEFTHFVKFLKYPGNDRGGAGGL